MASKGKKKKEIEEQRMHELKLAIIKHPGKTQALIDGVGFFGLVILYKSGFNLIKWLFGSLGVEFTGFNPTVSTDMGMTVHDYLGEFKHVVTVSAIEKSGKTGEPIQAFSLMDQKLVFDAVAAVNRPWMRDRYRRISEIQLTIAHLEDTLELDIGEDRRNSITARINELEEEKGVLLTEVNLVKDGRTLAPGVTATTFFNQLEVLEWAAAIGMAYATLQFLRQYTFYQAAENVPVIQ